MNAQDIGGRHIQGNRMLGKPKYPQTLPLLYISVTSN